MRLDDDPDVRLAFEVQRVNGGRGDEDFKYRVLAIHRYSDYGISLFQSHNAPRNDIARAESLRRSDGKQDVVRADAHTNHVSGICASHRHF